MQLYDHVLPDIPQADTVVQAIVITDPDSKVYL